MAWFFRSVIVVALVGALAAWHDARDRAYEATLKAAHDRRKAPYAAREMRPLRVL